MALAEYTGSGDVTTLATVPETAESKAEVRAREPLVVAGLALAEAAFRELSPAVQVTRFVEDGQRVAEETRFEDAPDQVGRIRFTHPVDGPLPHDEQAFPSSLEGVPPAESTVVDTHELTSSPSVWEAIDDDKPA